MFKGGTLYPVTPFEALTGGRSAGIRQGIRGHCVLSYMNQLKKEPFGRLMTLDLYGCKDGVCDDLSLCYNFLNDVADKLNMKKQSPPFIFKSDAVLYPDKAGLSGWVPLIESGIQIHTLALKRFISIDVYSCGNFKAENIEKYVQEYFGCKEVEANYIERGVRYNDIT